MSQNVVSVAFTPDQIASALEATRQIEAALPGLIALPAEASRGMIFMGERSQPFVRRTMRVLADHPTLVPPSLDAAGAQADLLAYDQLVPVLERLQFLTAQVQDTVSALGSDLMSVSLEAYGHIKVSGDDHGLEDLRHQLGSRWNRGRRPSTPPQA